METSIASSTLTISAIASTLVAFLSIESLHALSLVSWKFNDVFVIYLYQTPTIRSNVAMGNFNNTINRSVNMETIRQYHLFVKSLCNVLFQLEDYNIQC